MAGSCRSSCRAEQRGLPKRHSDNAKGSKAEGPLKLRDKSRNECHPPAQMNAMFSDDRIIRFGCCHFRAFVSCQASDSIDYVLTSRFPMLGQRLASDHRVECTTRYCISFLIAVTTLRLCRTGRACGRVQHLGGHAPTRLEQSWAGASRYVRCRSGSCDMDAA